MIYKHTCICVHTQVHTHTHTHTHAHTHTHRLNRHTTDRQTRIQHHGEFILVNTTNGHS